MLQCYGDFFARGEGQVPALNCESTLRLCWRAIAPPMAGRQRAAVAKGNGAVFNRVFHATSLISTPATANPGGPRPDLKWL